MKKEKFFIGIIVALVFIAAAVLSGVTIANEVKKDEKPMETTFLTSTDTTSEITNITESLETTLQAVDISSVVTAIATEKSVETKTEKATVAPVKNISESNTTIVTTVTTAPFIPETEIATSESVTIFEETESAETTTTTTYYVEPLEGPDGPLFIKAFSRGTFFGGENAVGGSGNILIDCATGDGKVNGSVASIYIYNEFGYEYEGKRTMVYIEVPQYPQMNGYYYVDDSNMGNPEVIDFYYENEESCPFYEDGVTTVYCWLVTYN